MRRATSTNSRNSATIFNGSVPATWLCSRSAPLLRALPNKTCRRIEREAGRPIVTQLAGSFHPSAAITSRITGNWATIGSVPTCVESDDT